MNIDWRRIRMLVMDVDGVLADGRVEVVSDGSDRRVFHVRDGFAIKQWLSSGGQAAIISGRRSSTVDNRARTLGIPWVLQGVEDKSAALDDVLNKHQLTDLDAAFIGDDLADLPAMRRCGFSVTPGDANPLVKRWSHYVARHPGGAGAVAETIELILRKQGRWTIPSTTPRG